MTRTCIFNAKKKKKNIERSKQESKMTSLREFNPLVLSELDLSYASRQKKNKKKKKKKKKKEKKRMQDQGLHASKQALPITKTNIF